MGMIIYLMLFVTGMTLLVMVIAPIGLMPWYPSNGGSQCSLTRRLCGVVRPGAAPGVAANGFFGKW